MAGYSGTLVLKVNSFWKTEKQFVQKPNLLYLLPERHVGDHTVISMKVLLGRESRPEVLLDNQSIFSMNNLVENSIVQEPRHSRTEV